MRTARSFGFAQDDSNLFAEDDSNLFAQDDSNLFAEDDNNLVFDFNNSHPRDICRFARTRSFAEKLFHADSRIPPAHQIRQAPSSETMHGPIGFLGIQALPNSLHSLG